MSTATYVIYYGFTVFKIDYLYCSKVRQKQTDLYRCDNRGRSTVLVIIILILLYRYKLRSQKEGIALNEVISNDVEITERLYYSKNEDELDDENTKSFLEQNINKNELLPKK